MLGRTQGGVEREQWKVGSAGEYWALILSMSNPSQSCDANSAKKCCRVHHGRCWLSCWPVIGWYRVTWCQYWALIGPGQTQRQDRWSSRGTKRGDENFEKRVLGSSFWKSYFVSVKLKFIHNSEAAAANQHWHSAFNINIGWFTPNEPTTARNELPVGTI